MSWHTGGAAIERALATDPAAVIRSLGLGGKDTGRTVSGEEASSSSLSGRAVGTVGGWTLVWDPMLLMGDDPSGAFGEGMFPAALEAKLAALSNRGRVFAFLMEGASGTYGYGLYAGGRRVRCWLSQEGSPVLDEGAPLPGESGFAHADDGEGRVLGMLEAITGVSLDDMLEVRFTVVE
jgi:hypothetical protein